MNKSLSLNTFIILSLTAAISSCGGGNSKVSNTAFSTDALISETHPITNDERNIATRICYAYQSKSKNYRSSGFVGTAFIFSASNIDCQNSSTNYQMNTTLKYDSNNELVYQPANNNNNNNLKFNNKVQTDTTGYLAQLCSRITNNQVISNTVDQQSVKIQISFFRDGLDGFYLQYFNKQSDNSYKIDSAEKLRVRTLIDFTTGKILGMDESYASQQVCTGQNKFSDFNQNFVSH